MILKELDNLYNRLIASGEDLPRRGWSLQKISYRIVLRPDGSLVRIEDARKEVVVEKKRSRKNKVENTTSTRLVSIETLVPGGSHPTGSGVNPCFLWDNPAYLLGCVEVKPRALEYFAAFRQRHLEVEKEINSPSFSAVCRFLEQWEPANCETLFADKSLYQGNGIFQIVDQDDYVHNDPTVKAWWQNGGSARWRGEKDSGGQEGICMVRGASLPLARLHEPAIQGVLNARTSGARLVSFNCDAFTSYGKEQGLNASVSEEAAFAYCNALNYLLRRPQQHVQLADATTVFWTDAPQARECECIVASVLEPERLEAQDKAEVKEVRRKLDKIVRTEPFTQAERAEISSVRFFILGLSPNAARLSIRFFMESTMEELVERLTNHFAAIKLQRRGEPFEDPEIISPFMILRETARETKEIPPLYSGSLMRAILMQTPYPDSIAMAILRRIRTDRHINYIRCAYLKAWLTRKKTSYSIQPMLDETNTHPGYLLGRLFAALQKTQEEAQPNVDRTIVDSFYGSASVSPGSVFPRVLRMHQHHLEKLGKERSEGAKVNRRKLVQSICSQLSHFPAHLTPEQQGLFALGFYHQHQNFYTSRNEEKPQ